MIDHKHGPVYQLRNCITCCVALVLSARPSRKHQEVMIAHASRYFTRDEILKEIGNANSGS